MQSAPLTFVVGTGRCGSTMLSRILGLHPDVLSISEFFSELRAMQPRTEFPTGDMDGQELWQILSGPSRLPEALVPIEERVPATRRADGGSRADAGAKARLPLISTRVLPMLTDDPDALFEQLAGQVPGWPRRPAADQYLALFHLMAHLLGRRVIVERSGGSLDLVTLLHREFPEGRFVHLHRDGPDCALSMSRYPAGRRAAISAEAVRMAGLPPSPSWEEFQAALPRLPGKFAEMLMPPFDMEQLMVHPVQVSWFGAKWSSMVSDGAAALSKLPADVWDSLKYEDLLRDPGTELTRIAAFIGVRATPEWLEAASGLIDPGQAGGAAQLGAAELAALQKACEPGSQAIAAVQARRLERDGSRA